MTAVAHRIHQPKVQWSFSRDEPYVSLSLDGEYSHTEKLDPCPAYMHPVGLVSKTLAKVEASYPIDPAPHVFLLPHESPTRTNGWAMKRAGYDEEPDRHQIVLSAKRIPIHPAMTRYLVAHEYGHIVEYDLLASRGLESHRDDILEEYQEFRGGQITQYGPGTWHTHVREIFANDFRILVANIEPEFWPHDVPHPDNCPEAQRWWAATTEMRPYIT